MTRDNKFREMISVTEAAESLSISISTLRKYSVLVEEVTGNKDYYNRTKKNSRLYLDKDIADLKSVKKLAKVKGLTLRDATRQVFAISNKSDTELTKNKLIDLETDSEKSLVSDAQVVKLLTILQNTISSQNEAINDLRKQVAKVEKQNKKLLDSTKALQPPVKNDQDEPVQDSSKEFSDIDELADFDRPTLTPEQKYANAFAEIEANKKKSGVQVHNEILQKSLENQKKRGQENIHRTLSDMQIPQQEHWWSNFFNSKK